jgi:hypothetical protein
MTRRMVDAALAYAARGYPLLPCEPGGKAPLGLLVPHGCLDATTEEATIRRWWARYPDANIGIATGAPGPDVLDVDAKNGLPGLDLLERLRLAGLLRGAIGIVRTPTFGLHLWYPGTARGGGALGPGRCLELKARGGYVLAPPSVTSAGEYVLLDAASASGELLDWNACRRLLSPPQPPRRIRGMGGPDIRHLAEWLEGQPKGNRNAALYWASCRAAEAGLPAGDLVAAAVAAGLPEDEAQRTALSALRRMGGAA